LQEWLENNKQATQNFFNGIITSPDSSLSPQENDIFIQVWFSENMQNRLKTHPQKHKREARNRFVDISHEESFRIIQEKDTALTDYPNILPWYIDQQ
jgi:hypothetical protein